MNCIEQAVGLSNSDWIAISSGAIAMLAFFATAWQAWLAWVHNRLTVKPQILSKRDTTITDQGLEIKMTIRNVGVGPALVIDRYFTVNGERFNPHGGDVVVSICEKILGGILKYKVLRNGMFGGKAVLAPGEEIVIIQLFFPDAGPDEEKKILNIASKAVFVVKYKSLYREDFVFSTAD